VSLLTTSGILLRRYPYSETSQILRFYTESRGVVGALARGVRKTGGRRGGPLSTFSEGILNVQFKDNRDLQTFRDFSPSRTRMGLASDPLRMAGASVLGELILQHAESEENPHLFRKLGLGLDALESKGPEPFLSVLLVHLWGLIQELGYGPLLDQCVECGRSFLTEEIGRFDYGAGGLRCPDCPGEVQGPRMGPGAREQLEVLLSGSYPEPLVKPETHLRLASDFITYHISGGKPLRSMAVLASLSKSPDA